MPWTTAPPTYRSILSHGRLHLRRKVRSPHPLGLPRAPRLPQLRKGRNLSGEVAAERARGAAPLDRGPRGAREGAPLVRGSPSPAGTQRPPRSCRAPPGRRDPPRTLNPELPGAPGGSRLTFPHPGPRASGPAGFRARDGAPRLGTRTARDGQGGRCRPRATDRRCPRAPGDSPSAPPQPRAARRLLSSDEPPSSPTLRGASPPPGRPDAVSPLLLCPHHPQLYGLQPLPRQPMETQQAS